MLNDYPDTILLADEELANPTLSLNQKVISAIVRRELGLGRQLATITDVELVKRTGLSKKTVKRDMRVLGYDKNRPRQGGYQFQTKHHDKLEGTLVSFGGILLTDEELADRKMEFDHWVILRLIEADLDKRIRGRRKHFTTITNAKFRRLTALSVSTIQRVLTELDKKMKRIGIVYVTVLPVEHVDIPNRRPTTYRHIYLDRLNAGHRKRQIKKSKLPMEESFYWYVVVGKMPKAMYLKMKRDETQKRREEEEKASLYRYKRLMQEFYAEQTDERLAELEKGDKVPAGTYLRQKQDYWRSYELGKGEKPDEDDDLFRDYVGT